MVFVVYVLHDFEFEDLRLLSNKHICRRRHRRCAEVLRRAIECGDFRDRVDRVTWMPSAKVASLSSTGKLIDRLNGAVGTVHAGHPGHLDDPRIGKVLTIEGLRCVKVGPDVPFFFAASESGVKVAPSNCPRR